LAGNGYLIKDQQGQVAITDLSSSGQVDLDNPAARKAYAKIIQDNMLAHKHWGWMGDFGEYVPLFGDSSNVRQHNEYPYKWAALQREVLDNFTQGSEVVFWSRSASLNSPGVSTLFWVGDQLCSFSKNDGLPTAVNAIITGGLSGHSLTHSDTGGYDQITVKPLFDYTRSSEVLRRWVEFSMFCVVLRTHEGTVYLNPANAQVYDDENIHIFANYTRVFASLFGYRKELIADASTAGWPVVRHMWLHFPDDPNVLSLSDQYMFGPDLLVKPVVIGGITEVSVYFPKGEWMNVWSQRNYTSNGQEFVVECPIGQPPVFLFIGDHEFHTSLKPFLLLASTILIH